VCSSRESVHTDDPARRFPAFFLNQRGRIVFLAHVAKVIRRRARMPLGDADGDGVGENHDYLARAQNSVFSFLHRRRTPMQNQTEATSLEVILPFPALHGVKVSTGTCWLVGHARTQPRTQSELLEFAIKRERGILLTPGRRQLRPWKGPRATLARAGVRFSSPVSRASVVVRRPMNSLNRAGCRPRAPV